LAINGEIDWDMVENNFDMLPDETLGEFINKMLHILYERKVADHEHEALLIHPSIRDSLMDLMKKRKK